MAPKLYIRTDAENLAGYKICQVWGYDIHRPNMIKMPDDLLARFLELEAEAIQMGRIWPDELSRIPIHNKECDTAALKFKIDSDEFPELVIEGPYPGGIYYPKLSQFLRDLRQFIEEKAPTPETSPQPAPEQPIPGDSGIEKRRWPDLKIQVSSEDTRIIVSEKGSTPRELTKDALNLTPGDLQTLQRLAVGTGDLAKGQYALSEKDRAALKRLRKKLKGYFSAYADDPIPDGKTAFKIAIMKTGRESEIEMLYRTSQSEDDGMSQIPM